MRKILDKPNTSGWLMKWFIESSEFVMQNLSRLALKAQVLSDYVLEMTFSENIREELEHKSNISWKLFVDGSSNQFEIGARIILISSDNIEISYALRFEFKVSNNKVYMMQ